MTFNSNGGSAVTSEVDEVGFMAPEPDEPTKADKVFAGWYYDNTTFLNEVEFPVKLTTNLTVYAKWEDS